MIRRFAAPFACTLVLIVASCGGNLAPIAASLTPAVLSPETIATMRTWCTRGAPLLEMARNPVMPAQAREIADVVAPYCAALVAGQVPPTTDQNTPHWLPENIAGLAAALGISLR